MCLMECPLELPHLLLPLPILNDLLRELFLILFVILFFEVLIVRSNYVLFFLLPPKLFFFEVSDVFYFLAFLHKALVGLLVDFLKVLYVLLALGLGVVVHFERTLGPHEIWVSVMVV